MNATKKITRQGGNGFGEALKKEIEAIPVDMINIDQIKDPKKHDRSQFDENAILSLAQNIKEEGLLQPIVVRQLEDGTYERVAGFRRIKAVLLNGDTQILARIIKAKDELSALKAMFSENTQREGLNSFDKAVFMEEIIIATMNATEHPDLINMNTVELKRRLTRMRNRKANSIVTDPTDNDIIFEDTIKTKILPLYGLGIDAIVGFMNILDFDKLIVEAIKNGKIGRTSAAEINKLSKTHAKNIPEAIERAYLEEMGRRDVANMVDAYLKSKKETQPDFIKGIGKMLNFSKLSKENQAKAEDAAKQFIALIKSLQVNK